MIQLFRYEIRSQRKRFLAIALMITVALSCYMIIDSFIAYANNRIASEAKPIAGADIVVERSTARDAASDALVGDIIDGQ